MDRGEIPGFWYGMSLLMIHDDSCEVLLEYFRSILRPDWVLATRKGRESGK